MNNDEWVIHSFGEFLHGISHSSSSSKWGSLKKAITFPTKATTQHFLDTVVLAGPPDSYGPMHINEALCVEVLER